MSLLTFFNQVWMWCLSLFGGQNRTNTLSANDSSPKSPTDLLNMTQLLDVTGNEMSFISSHTDFYRNLSLRHGAPNFKLNFHFMSGAAIYHSQLDQNILFERLFYSLDEGKGHRAIVDKSFVLYTPWTSDWTAPSGPSQLLPVNETAGSIYADDFGNTTRCMEGPEDPRVILDEGRDQVHVNFNIMTPSSDRQMFGKSYSIDELTTGEREDDSETEKENSPHLKIQPVEKLTQFQHAKGYRAGTEKNWVPIMIQGELHYVYSLAPLRILKCQLPTTETANAASAGGKSPKREDVTDYKKICTVQFKGEPVDSGSQTGALRSGTNWVEFSPGVYFSLARTRFMHKKCSYGLYRPHLIIMRFEVDSKSGAYSKPRIIYASEPITRFDDQIFQKYLNRGLGNGDKCDDRAVLTPGSISHWTGMEDGDRADVIISVNDDLNVMLRFTGMGAAVQAALNAEPTTKKSRFMSGKNAVTVKAEREMKKFIEKSFARVFKEKK